MEEIQVTTLSGRCQTKVSKAGLMYDDFLHVQKGGLVFGGEPVDFMSKEEPRKIMSAFDMSAEKRTSLFIGRFYEKKLQSTEKHYDILFTFSKETEVRQISIIMKKSDLAKFLAYFSLASLESM